MALTKDLWVAYTRIFFVELAYWIISIGMVFVNEFVLSDKSVLTEDLTIFITVFQILFSLSILLTLNYITKQYLNPFFDNEEYSPAQRTTSPASNPLVVSVSSKLMDNDELDQNRSNESIEQTSSVSYRTKRKDSDGLIQLLVVNIPHRINLETCKVVFPLSILYIGMLLLNNFCLKYVGVAFYFVSRSLTTVFNVTFTYFLINEPVSRGALVCCAFIVLGFILGIDQESVIGSLSVLGVVFGVLSSLFGSLCSIYTKKTLSKLDKNIWVLVLYNNINAIVICTPLLLVHGDIQALFSEKVISPTFWLLLSISGVMAFFISIVTNASIKYTSPLTHNISGTAKACLQTVIAVIYAHDHKSPLWWLSNITILVASAAYSRIKQLEMEQRSTSLPQNVLQLNQHHDEREIRSMISKDKPRRRDSSSSGCSATSEINHLDTQSDNCCSVELETTENSSS